MLSSLQETIASWSFVDIFNFCVLCAFSVCYFYQLAYIAVSLVKRPRDISASSDHRYAILISARNEEEVIGDLLDSLADQDYPSDLYDIFVIADNCTDSTASVARQHGAQVLIRNNQRKIGKGYALNWGLHRIWERFSESRTPRWTEGAEKCPYEAYFVFDADNVVDRRYLSEMNKTFDSGAKASTSYRNSKNFGTNWISAGYGLWFLREARFLSQARLVLGTSCAISGTGFFISHELLRDAKGWKWHLLTEDIEFSADQIASGEKISYCPKAVFYDEQPETFKTSWNQRYRWAKGFYQVFSHYSARLVKGMFKNPKGRKWACYDMLMTIAPGMLLTVISLIFNLIIAALCMMGAMSIGSALMSSLSSVVFCIANFWMFMFVLGTMTAFIEWNNILTSAPKKVLYCLTFPFFMLSYVPIAICALFGKAKWTPIPHNVHMKGVPGSTGANTEYALSDMKHGRTSSAGTRPVEF